jgi:uncharacterized hydrophobic protein (TIGR00271 family)
MKMKILLIITHSKMVENAVSWLSELACRQNSELLIANCVLNPIAVPNRIGAWPLIEEPQKVRSALDKIIADLPSNNISLLPEISGQFPNQEVTQIVEEQKIDILYFPLDAEMNPGTPDMQFAQKLLFNAPCDILLVDLGENDRNGIERILVPMDLAASGNTLRHVIKLSSKREDIVPLHIAQDFGGDSKRIASSELDLQLKEAGLTESLPQIIPKVVMADGFNHGLIKTVKAKDGIVLTGKSVKRIHQLRMQLFQIHPEIATAVAIGVFHPAGFAAKTKLGRIGRRLKLALPELTLADRISLFDRIQGGARLTTDYVAMIGLSVLIASLGLLADNSSVVIGAMLVAPFMTPLIGIGLALAQGNLILMKKSAIATGTGLIVGLCLSLILGVLHPLDELPLEILARGDPNIIDLAIAYVSGMAGAYAISRQSVTESIVGVAIAAALVPPLACVGIMIANADILEAQGAFLLLVTNLAAIALGAATVFRYLGVPGTRTGQLSSVKIRWIGIALTIMLIILAIPLGYRMAKQVSVGQIRPMSFRVSSKLKHAVNEHVEKIDGLSVMTLGRSGSGKSKLIRILLSTEKPVPDYIIEDIKESVEIIMGQGTPVLIKVFQNAVISEGKPTPKISAQSENSTLQ